jgi:hypothetical protein
MQDTTKPTVGLSTQAGLGASSTITLAAIIDAIASGHVDADQWRAWLLAALIFIVTQLGRYLQAAQAAQGEAQAKALTAARATAGTSMSQPTFTTEVALDGRAVARSLATDDLPTDDDEAADQAPPPETATPATAEDG